MEIIISGLIFVLLIGVLVIVHEFGHFIVAKKAGMVVEEFAIGFGPILYSVQKKETKYSLRALPIGGFVKLLGDMDASSFRRYQVDQYNKNDKDFALSLIKKSDLSLKKSSYHEIKTWYLEQEKKLAEKDFQKLHNWFVKDFIPNHPGNFDNKSISARSAVTIAGIIMNILLAFLIFYIYFFFNSFTTDLVKIGNPVFFGASISNPPFISNLYLQDKSELENTIILDANTKTHVSFSNFEEILNNNYNNAISLRLFGADGFKNTSLFLDGDGIKSNFDSDVKDKTKILFVNEDSPAEKAGLQAQSIFLKIAQTEVFSIQDVQKLLEENRGQETSFQIVNPKGEVEELSIELNENLEDPALGVVLTPNVGYINNVLRVDYRENKVLSGVLHTFNVTSYTVSGFAELINQSINQQSLEPVSQGVTSIVGVANFVVELVQINDFLSILNLAGLVSVALAFVNILPIPLFDGGNLLFLGLEKIRGKKLSSSAQEKIGLVSFVLIIILMIAVVLKDIVQFDLIGKVLRSISNIFQ